MKETGLMFKAPLVRAILDRSKTQTRRIANDVKHPGWGHLRTPGEIACEPQYAIDLACPYGGPGDRIYVRETWAPNNVIPACHRPGRDYLYAATDAETYAVCRWNPSIHMPKSASRIWLEVTSVRVERLQQITEADCIAEGIEFFNNDRECGCKNYMDKTGKDWTLTAHQSFRSLWESTGGDWAANPYVWVIDFKQIPLPREQGS